MITPKIKALFQFIEYLHSNIENFNQYNGLIKEVEQLQNERSQLKSKQNYKDKLECDKIDATIKSKKNVLHKNIFTPTQNKAFELNIYNGYDTFTIKSWNNGAITNLKENFSKKDLTEILEKISLYRQFKYRVNPFLLDKIFFIDLNETLHELFSFFNDETKQFETKVKPVNSIEEYVKEFKKGKTNVVLPFNALFNTSYRQQTQKQALQPQQSEKLKPELTINQIALKYIYSEIQITRENGNEIAKQYGHSSGEKLFQRFTFYSSAANRKGKPNLCTPRKLNNKIKLIESIVELLPTDKQERAKDEVSILKKIYEAEYQ